MRRACGPVLTRPAVSAPAAVALPAVGLAVLAVVAALAAGLAAGSSTPERRPPGSWHRPVAELVTPTPGVLVGDRADSSPPVEPAATARGPVPAPR